MSYRKHLNHIAAAALGITVAGALVAAAAIGLTGFPPARAYAAPGAEKFGVVAETAVEIGPEVGADDKLDSALASAGKSQSARKRLAAPAAKARPKMPVRKAVVRVAPRVIAKATAPAPRARRTVRAAATAPRVAKVAVKRTSTAGWKSARVSWYGPGFYGNGMAGGGTLQPDSMVVAHRTLAFGTKVRFSYGGRTVTATVQDRGPHVSGREFDLGPGTAKALGFSGVGTVRYLVLGR